MATISDQLAADIRTAFARYEVDTGNQQPICTGTALLGGQENIVQIYGVRKQSNQTQYRAGYPFNWSWVSANTFSSTTYH